MAHETNASVYDIRAAAALGLGFFTRYYLSDELNLCLLTLAIEIHPNVYTSLNGLVARIDTSYKNSRLAGARTSSSPSDPYIAWQHAREMKALGRFADRAFADRSDLWPWYRAGATLGDCELLQGSEKLLPEHLEWVLECLENLPEGARNTMGVVRELLELDCRDADPVIEVFEHAVHEGLRDHEYVMRSIYIEKASYIVRFVNAMLDGITRLPPSQQDGRQEARDLWLYNQLCAMVPHKQIISQLKSYKEWDPILSKQGLGAALKRFIDRKGLPHPKARGPGRPANEK